jgi:carbamoyltransferase
MQSVLNLKVKYRESFRPFAPSVLCEHVADWFEIDADSPCMLVVADVVERRRRAMTQAEQSLFGIEKLNVPRSEIPAVTHVDYSARIQTVHADTKPRYHALISSFKQLTGCPVLINTSFNVRGQPIRAYAGGCFPVLHGFGNRAACRRQLSAPQERPEP